MESLPAPNVESSALQNALLKTGQWLQQQGYHFITVTPATHKIVNGRHSGPAGDLRDIFGWSRPFRLGLLNSRVADLLDGSDLLEHLPQGLVRSRVRFSSLDGPGPGPSRLYAHSAYPTTGADSVFFGPDTCRFVALVRSELNRRPLGKGTTILDIGCGAGPGGVEAALASCGAQPHLVLSDINPKALELAQVNAALAGLADVDVRCGDLYIPVPGTFDLIVANPPYLIDQERRAYRHGGGDLGATLSERIVNQGVGRLAPGGRLILYTGSAIVDGKDLLRNAIQSTLKYGPWAFRYWELDPDIFGEELLGPSYRKVERIAAVALVVERSGLGPST